MRHPGARARAGGVAAWLPLAVALAAPAGCAKDPTELLVTVSIDGTPSRSITSLLVILDAGGNQTSRRFASLDTIPADADVAPFAFPSLIDYLISNDAIAGAVTVTVEGSDPLTSDALLAHGMATATVAHRKTTAVAVTLALDAPPEVDGGMTDGAVDDASDANDDGPAGDDGGADAGADLAPAAP